MTRFTSRDSLCFCEYENIKGERSHLLATFCNCEALDSICDNILRCESIPKENIKEVAETIQDRFRIPFIGGAKRIRMDIYLPFIILPFSLFVGAMGFYWMLFSFTLAFLSLRLLGKLGRNQVYYSTLKAAFLTIFVIFMTCVIGFRKVLLWEIMLLLTSFLMTLWFLHGARSDPGYIHRHSRTHDRGEPMLQDKEITWIDSRPIIDGVLNVDCLPCGIIKPARSGHCPKCEKCVCGRDHHCDWLDICIGQHNHRSFFFFLVMTLLVGLYMVNLTMTSICTPEIYLDWVLLPSDCRFLYSDFPTGLCICTVFFTSCGLIFIVILLLQQIIYISQNVTSLEMVKARKMKRSSFFLFSSFNSNNRGFIVNWLDFLRNKRKQSYQ